MGYNQKTIPVILGNDYKGVYDIGEVFLGDYLFELVSFKVVGVLKENSFVFYQGNAEFYLDNVVVIPYPEKRPDNNFKDKGFLNRLYFGMINGNIATNNDMEISEILSSLNKIGKQTKFSNYHIIGVSSFVEQYTDMLMALTKNKELIIVLFSMLFILMVILLNFISYTLFVQRKNKYYVYYLNGFSKKIINKWIIIDTFFPIIISIIPYTIFLFISRIGSNLSFIIMTAILIVLGTSTSLFLIKIGLKRHLIGNFRRERC
ncbi:hypothetical protein A5880_002585 [Enterococcus sp. 4G2_DIV0659]|uniref:ABC transporter permease n=1 Tax=Candidatus Enterococcus mansonii TaxID=1834181 RepID=A0ABU8IHS9_9ENTE